MSESLDKALDFATSQLASIIDAAKAATPQAVDAAMQVVRLTAVSNLADGVMSLAIAAGGALISKRLWAWGTRLDENHYTCEPAYIASFVVAVLSGIIAIVGITELVNIWNWVGLWHPELYAIHQTLAAAGGHK